MAQRWKVDIRVSGIEADSDKEYDDKVEEIIQGIKLKGYEADSGVGVEEDDY